MSTEKNRQTKSVKEVSAFSILLRSPERRVFYGTGYYSDPTKCPDSILNLYRGPDAQPTPEMEWLKAVLTDGGFQSKAYGFVAWSDEPCIILKDAMYRSFVEAVPSKPPVSREGFAKFWREHFDLSSTRKVTPKSGRTRLQFYRVVGVEEARRIVMGRKNE